MELDGNSFYLRATVVHEKRQREVVKDVASLFLLVETEAPGHLRWLPFHRFILT